jgi:hypothetical protein
VADRAAHGVAPDAAAVRELQDDWRLRHRFVDVAVVVGRRLLGGHLDDLRVARRFADRVDLVQLREAGLQVVHLRCDRRINLSGGLQCLFQLSELGREARAPGQCGRVSPAGVAEQRDLRRHGADLGD